MGSDPDATGELLCIPPGPDAVRKLVGPILLVIDREADESTSALPEGLLLPEFRTARLDEDPPRVVYEDVCIRSGSARPARACSTIAYRAKKTVSYT